MVTLILVLCLQGGTQCVERPMAPLDPITTLSGCMMAGPQAGAEWIKDHPMQAQEGWRFARWKCQWGKREERGA